MSNVTIHVVIPILLVMATRLFPTKTVLMWAPFTFIPDFDFVFNLLGFYVLDSELLLHRAILHNFFVIVPTLIIAVVLWRRMLERRPGLKEYDWLQRWHAFGAVRAGYGCVLATFFLFSHVMLDMFTGGVTPLWPVLNVYVYPRFILWVDMQTLLPRLQTEFVTGTGAPTLSTEFPWLTPEQIAIWLLVLIGAVVMVVREKYMAKAEAKRPKRLEEAPVVEMGERELPEPPPMDEIDRE